MYFTKYDLKIDIERLGKAYFDFRHHLGFRTDDKSLRDFNAICVNQYQMMKTVLQVVT